MPLAIRVENPDDGPAISRVNRLAFGRQDEARLAERLREGGWARISLVAQLDAQIVGHLLFSHLPIVTPAGTICALALAPLAVLPEHQSQGIGSELVGRGLDICRRQGHTIVIVLGHPHYYPRFGFSAELARPLESPYAGESFMALELIPGALEGVSGRVEYPPPFGEF
ncbi:MAG: N-acetyltransferase [Pirellulales bacterium]